MSCPIDLAAGLIALCTGGCERVPLRLTMTDDITVSCGRLSPLVIREEVMDELLVADESPLAGQLAEPSDDATLYTEYRRLAAEQAALRRLATLVARGVEPWEVFDAVTKEMCRCVPAEGAGLWRYETSDEITMVAATYHPAADPTKWPVGARTSTAGNTLASMV